MASTTTSPNNAAVKFRGRKEREMARKDGLTGVSTVMPKPAKPAAKPARARQRARMTARKMARRGLISETAMKKHMGEGF
jgi:hypothetical protein